MGFSRQECWSEQPFFSPGDIPDSGIEPASPVSPTLAGLGPEKPLSVFLVLSQSPCFTELAIVLFGVHSLWNESGNESEIIASKSQSSSDESLCTSVAMRGGGGALPSAPSRFWLTER